MKDGRRILVAALWILSLVGVARWASAQGDPLLHSEQPPVIDSGDDIGVRVYPRVWNDVPVARIVVRIDGKWQEVQIQSNASK